MTIHVVRAIEFLQFASAYMVAGSLTKAHQTAKSIYDHNSAANCYGNVRSYVDAEKWIMCGTT